MIALIDGDGLLYAAAWRKKSEVKRLGPKTFWEAQESYNKRLKEMLAGVFAKDYAVVFGGPENYRDKIYKEYKKSKTRKASRTTKPDWFGELKEFAARKEGAVLSKGCEADDYLRIWATELTERSTTEENKFVICSGDKDLDCIAGLHYCPKNAWNPPRTYKVEQDYSDHFFWTQMLMGDSIDNIPGIELIGPRKAEKILDGATTNEERERRVCAAYIKKYGTEEGYARMLSNGKMLWMWRYYGDHFTYDKEVFLAAGEG